MKEIIKGLIYSWKDNKGNVNTTEEIIEWVNVLNNNIHVNIKKIALEECKNWHIDNGEIVNRNRSFFSIKGLQKKLGDQEIEQPVIIQDEIGYLGIICKEINGVINFLMQAKIEPGNVNKIQISPTIQATKSNFTQQHGGRKPNYLEYFFNVDPKDVIVDQIQSEQSSRFYKKRNRNIIIKIEDEIEVLNNYKWMTLGQIKALMKIDNLVNMDTRTVISCIPYSIVDFNIKELEEIEQLFSNKQALFNSIFKKPTENLLPQIFNAINNYKMFEDRNGQLIALDELKQWKMQGNDYFCLSDSPYKVVFCNIEIAGREVRQWDQPLFEAIGMATFGMFVCIDHDCMKFLVKLKPEIGCFDQIELGPTVQLEPMESYSDNEITKLFMEKWKTKDNVLYDVVLSEEGGRFYHEQNYNVIIQIDKEEIKKLPDDYFWVDYYTLNMLVQVNNCLNIQLRNLLSLLEV